MQGYLSTPSRSTRMQSTCNLNSLSRRREENPANSKDLLPVAKVDFIQVKAILSIYNRVKQCVDKIKFEDENNQTLAQLTLNIPIACEPHLTMQFTSTHYLLAGIFTGDLDFLAHFFGHQGASAKWLCLFCLSMQEKLDETFRLEGDAPLFQERKGAYLHKVCFETYKSEFLDLMLTMRTKTKRNKSRRSYRIVLWHRHWPTFHLIVLQRHPCTQYWAQQKKS